jgi:ribosomal protein S18 acetylase RimI-like enzyme
MAAARPGRARRWLPAGVAAAVMLAGGGVAAVAAIPDAGTGVFHGCYSTKTGALRLIGPAKRQKCKAGEKAVTWDQAGITWKGAWAKAKHYPVHDAVSYLGSSYLAVRASTGIVPAGHPADWAVLAQAGKKGATGRPGTPGRTLLPGQVTLGVGLPDVLSATGDKISEPDAVAFDGSDLWIANSSANSVTEVRASNGSLVRVLSNTSNSGFKFNNPDAIGFDGTDLWIANDVLAPASVTEVKASNGSLVRAPEGSEIADRGDYVSVRTAANPVFYWGNFLLLPAEALSGPPDRWLSLFATEFPAARHVALGFDVTDGLDADLGQFEATGLAALRDVVLVAKAPGEPPHPGNPAEIRPLASDRDWEQAVSLQVACDSEEGGDADEAFVRSRFATRRAITGAGHGVWFGAFRDGDLAAQLGVFSDGTGLARYQDIATHPGARRQGLAATLVCHAGRYAIDQLGAKTLVIVADPTEPAIRVYRSVGFAEQQAQVGLQRGPVGD